MTKTTSIALIALLSVLLLATSSSLVVVGINQDRGERWLLSQQNSDGSFRLPSYYGFSTGIRSTYLSVSALGIGAISSANTSVIRCFARNVQEPYGAVYAWLVLSKLGFENDTACAGLFVTTVEYYFSTTGILNASRFHVWDAYLITQVLRADKPAEYHTRQLIFNWLLEARNNDGSFGRERGSDGNARATAWGIMALARLGAESKVVSPSVCWLCQRQLPNDGFEEKEKFGYGSVTTTSWAIVALREVDLLSRIDVGNALRFIASHQLLDGGFEDFTTWRLGFRKADGEATALALWATSSISTQPSLLWPPFKTVYTYAYTTACFLMLLTAFIALVLSASRHRVRTMLGIRRSRPLRNRRKFIANVVVALVVPLLSLTFPSVPYLDVGLLIVFFMRFNLGRLHKIRKLSLFFLTILPLVVYIDVENSMMALYTRARNMDISSLSSVLQFVSQNSEGLVGLLARLVLAIFVSAFVLLFSTNWKETNVRYLRSPGRRDQEDRISYFWGHLVVAGQTYDRYNRCLFESSAFFLVLMFLAATSGTSTATHSWLSEGSHPISWYGVLILVWTVYDVLVLRGSGETEESLWLQSVRVSRSSSSMLYLLVMLFTILVSVLMLSINLQPDGNMLAYSRIFENIDMIQMFGWISSKTRAFYEQATLLDLSAIGWGILCMLFVCIHFPFWAYKFLKTEALKATITVNSMVRLVVGIIAGYVSTFLELNHFSMLAQVIQARDLLLRDSGLLQLQIQLGTLCVGMGLVSVYTCSLAVEKPKSRMLTPKEQRALTAALFGPTVLIMTSFNAPFAVIFVSGLGACALSWNYVVLWARGARRYQSSEDPYNFAFYSIFGTTLILLGGYYVLIGLYGILLALPHAAGTFAGESAKNRVKFYLGIQGIKHKGQSDNRL
jgi:prenyltransferase beta subunit